MQFLKIKDNQPVVSYFTKRIAGLLVQGKRVLWIVSGGSAIEVEVAIADGLKAYPNTKNLIIMQVDERYGPVGHADSNWYQLQKAGFAEDNFTVYPMLVGQPLEQTVELYAATYAKQLNQTDFHIGLFGMGADGHTAGILPGNVAANEQEKLLIAYQGPDYMRITITPAVIKQMDEAILLAKGESKQLALEHLQRQFDALDQPAQILKQAQALLVYNDRLGEDI